MPRSPDRADARRELEERDEAASKWANRRDDSRIVACDQARRGEPLSGVTVDEGERVSFAADTLTAAATHRAADATRAASSFNA
jgi:hypothetical protein